MKSNQHATLMFYWSVHLFVYFSYFITISIGRRLYIIPICIFKVSNIIWYRVIHIGNNICWLINWMNKSSLLNPDKGVYSGGCRISLKLDFELYKVILINEWTQLLNGISLSIFFSGFLHYLLDSKYVSILK